MAVGDTGGVLHYRAGRLQRDDGAPKLLRRPWRNPYTDPLSSHGDYWQGHRLHKRMVFLPRKGIEMDNQEQVIVIGCGPAGLAAAATLIKQGIEPLILDENTCITQSWHAHYDALKLNSIKQLSALPMRPMPKAYPRYPSRDQMLHYFADYAQAFGIKAHLGQRVTSVSFTDGAWQVRTDEQGYQARKVVIATGMNHLPQEPSIEGLADFTGRVMHSHAFKSGADYAGQRVLVVGGGNSAADIAMDLQAHEAKVDIVIRSPTHVTPLDLLGVPAQVTSWLLFMLPLALADLLAVSVLRLVYGDLSPYGIRQPAQGPISRIVDHARVPLFDRGIIKLIKAGVIKVRAGIKRIDRQTVLFEDGASADYDVIVFATGYRSALADLLPNNHALLSTNDWPEKTATDMGHGLYFIGFNETPRGLLYEIGKEAERIAAAISADITR